MFYYFGQSLAKSTTVFDQVLCDNRTGLWEKKTDI